MAEFFRTSTIWVVDYRYDGHPRRWFKAFAAGDDVAALAAAALHDAHGDRARLEGVRPATEEEERQSLRDETPGNRYCPTGR
jgi:hypothetical protein